MSDPKASVREYFDKDAEGYLAAYSQQGQVRGEIFRQRRRLSLELIRQPVGLVLDIGSGPGVFTNFLLQKGAECWVVDLSLRMVTTARNQISGSHSEGRIHYSVADIDTLPFQSHSFNTVLCIGVLQYLRTPCAALKELSRVTRIGGQVVISFPNRCSPLNGIHRVAVSALRAGRASLRWIGIHARPNGLRLTFREDIPNQSFSLDQLEETFRYCGFRLDEIVYHSLHLPFSLPGLKKLLKGWERLATYLFRGNRLKRWGREVIVRLIRRE